MLKEWSREMLSVAKRVRRRCVARTIGRSQVGCSQKSLDFGDHREAMGPLSCRADGGDRESSSGDFQGSRQPCSLLPSSEAQPMPTREIPSETRAKVIYVCSGVSVWCVVYRQCAWVLCVVCMYMCVECVFTESEPWQAQD